MKYPVAFLGLAASAMAGSASVCPRDNTHTSGAALQAILDYKAGAHEIMATYFRAWRDTASNSSINRVSMDQLPDCVDVALVFTEGDEPDSFYSALKATYVPALRSRGTKVVRSTNIDTLLDTSYTNDAAGYAALAQHIIDTLVTPAGLDGLDVDVEKSLSGAQLQQAAGVFAALSKSLGPRSGTGKLLIYDTNLDGDEALFGKVARLVDYVFIQSYGRSVSGLQGTWDSYSPHISSSQYLIGFSFYEERGAHWGDTNPPMSSSRAYQYAKWEPSGTKKGGIFSYAVDRDGVADGNDNIVPTDFSWTRGLISAMNP